MVPATRTVRSIPTEVLLDDRDGMPSPCVLSFDNVTVVPRAALGSRITRLGDARLAEICSALRVAAGCG